MESSSAPSGSLGATVIPGPNHPKPHESLGQALLLVSVVAGWVLGVIGLVLECGRHIWWPLGATAAVVLVLWLLIHFAPPEKG